MSATIYAFPPRGRYATGGQREDAKPAPIVTFGSRTTHPVMGDAWYHDEAIDHERKPKNQ